ncbi:hypothetical protein GA0115245_144328 [Streptomyces sp. di188]|nr:hypothetical protein GA0115238_14064 [Streptomyces sp. di50b]SCE50064.1 hypothetical protein GA0115245_144328 [Streptomyces sp. di188]
MSGCTPRRERRENVPGDPHHRIGPVVRRTSRIDRKQGMS